MNTSLSIAAPISPPPLVTAVASRGDRLHATAAAIDMERSIARCRVVLSLVAIVAVYDDPTNPMLTRWLPLTGGAFSLNRYQFVVLLAHLAYSLTMASLHRRMSATPARLAAVATGGDVLFGEAIALVTEGLTSEFYVFFAIAVVTVGL